MLYYMHLPLSAAAGTRRLVPSLSLELALSIGMREALRRTNAAGSIPNSLAIALTRSSLRGI